MPNNFSDQFLSLISKSYQLQSFSSHQQHAHCESGVTANLLHYSGIKISEPLAFGIGSGLFFAHIPFFKISGTPGTAYRIWPGYIFKSTCKRLGIKVKTQKYKNPQEGKKALDDLLNRSIPVGLQTSVYYLDYLPESFRFHFNAHNLICYGKEGNQYLVSDPVIEEEAIISAESLEKARYAKGALSPVGKLYYIEDVPKELPLKVAIKKGIRKNCFFMLNTPLPWFGLKAIPTLAKQLLKYPDQLSDRKRVLYLSNIIRMQEEIGTGGGGFRYLYAAFLQEASKICSNNHLFELSKDCTIIGDHWRDFAYYAARICKVRSEDNISFKELSQKLICIYHLEKKLFTKLRKVSKDL